MGESDIVSFKNKLNYADFYPWKYAYDHRVNETKVYVDNWFISIDATNKVNIYLSLWYK